MPGTLPSQRELLSNLVHSLCETHHDYPDGSAAAAATRAAGRYDSPAASPWDSPKHKKLILTLHVVFPGMLLPALDLLDRKLVRRLMLDTAPTTEDHRQDAACPSPARQDQVRGEMSGAGRHAVYTVRSAASTMPRRGAAAATRAYLVHLEAWNCSCAAFAVDAYAAGRREGLAEAGTRMGGFGGLSATSWDSHGAETTPCCKHLLACLLVDEWEELLATHVEVKRCTREELAGIIAGI